MRVDILSIFPEMFQGPFTESLLKKAQEKNIVSIALHDLRSFTTDKHHCVDDRSFGGGPGMVMKPEPIHDALVELGAIKKRASKKNKPWVIYMSPQGKTLTQERVNQLSQMQHLVVLCGHYEGIDERAFTWIDEEISIGDYVLTGGEIPAMVLIDSVVRQLPGVVKESASLQNDSFYNGLLDYPHYTRPETFMKMKVPDVLMSGHHARIEQWRREQSLAVTLKKRPDLIEKSRLNDNDMAILRKIKKSLPAT
jgi:tRNA (guanine37-N1)-methyltransferase